jgi:hypothetical protein
MKQEELEDNEEKGEGDSIYWRRRAGDGHCIFGKTGSSC